MKSVHLIYGLFILIPSFLFSQQTLTEIDINKHGIKKTHLYLSYFSDSSPCQVKEYNENGKIIRERFYDFHPATPGDYSESKYFYSGDTLIKSETYFNDSLSSESFSIHTNSGYRTDTYINGEFKRAEVYSRENDVSKLIWIYHFANDTLVESTEISRNTNGFSVNVMFNAYGKSWMEESKIIMQSKTENQNIKIVLDTIARLWSYTVYDSINFVITHSEFSMDNGLVSRSISYFRSDWKHIRFEEYDKKNELTRMILYNYDSNGNNLGNEVFDKKNRILSKSVNLYNSQGLLIESEYWIKSKLDYTLRMEYEFY